MLQHRRRKIRDYKPERLESRQLLSGVGMAGSAVGAGAGAPEIQVTYTVNNQPISQIVDGDNTPTFVEGTEFGTVDVGAGLVANEHVFKIANIGTAPLKISNLVAPKGFVFTELPDPVVPPDTTTLIAIALDSAKPISDAGGWLSFETNDADENPFNFALHGKVTADGGGGGGGTTNPNDLAAVSVTGVKPGSFIGGVSKGGAKFKYTNSGTETIKQTINSTFYLSTDKGLDAADKAIAGFSTKVTLKPGKSKTLSAKGVYPVVPDGQYYVLAKVDSDNQIPENNESNNVAASDISVTVAEPYADPGLAYVTAPTTAKLNKPLKLKIGLANYGNEVAAGHADLTLWVSIDQILGNDDDRMLATLPLYGTIKPGKVNKFGATVSPPANGGTYYIAAHLDTTGLDSDSLANNTVWSTKTITLG